MIDDPDLLGLSAADPTRLTGEADARLVKLRYRAGERAVLHLRDARGDAVAWFFAGDKARQVAARSGGRLDPSGALVERFPRDHRLPALAAFLSRADGLRIGGLQLSGIPECLRYRPGLSCTFRCRTQDGAMVYAKIAADPPPPPIDGDLPDRTHIARRLAQDDALGLVIVEAADGNTLETEIDRDPVALDRALVALTDLNDMGTRPIRRLDAATQIGRARSSARLVAALMPDFTHMAMHLLDRVTGSVPYLREVPVHGDVKPEHVFLAQDRVTLIDSESMAMGDPDHDRAQLIGRLALHGTERGVSSATTVAWKRRIVSASGPAIAWHLDLVALSLLKFFAQRPTERHIGARIARLVELAAI